MELSETQRAYAAGLFDGEGSVVLCFARRGGRYSYRRFVPRVEVSSTDEPVIDWFVVHFGGSKHSARGSRLGRKPAWVWVLTGKVALLRFVESVMPFALIKKPQLIVFRAALSHVKPGRNKPFSATEWEQRQRFSATMTLLNRGNDN